MSKEAERATMEEELVEVAWFEEEKNESFNATAYLAQFGIVVG